MAKKRKGGVNLSELIRKMFDDMGPNARGADVYKKLVDDGHNVSRALISNVLKRHTGAPVSSRRGGGKKVKVKLERSAPVRRESASSGALTVEALLAAKKFAQESGGYEAAKMALDAIARLA